MPETANNSSPSAGTVRDEVRLSLERSLVENAAVWAALAQEDTIGGTETKSAAEEMKLLQQHAENGI